MELRHIDRHAASPGLSGHFKRHDQPSTFFIVASNWSGLKGLTIQPVAPADLPACFLSIRKDQIDTSALRNIQGLNTIHCLDHFITRPFEGK
jgi:hypothetical protein